MSTLVTHVLAPNRTVFNVASTSALWESLDALDANGASQALLAGADPNAIKCGAAPLQSLYDFDDETASALALTLVLCGAAVGSDDIQVH